MVQHLGRTAVLLEHRSLGYWLMMSARSQIQSLVVVAVVVGGVVLVVYVAVIFVLVVIVVVVAVDTVDNIGRH